MFMKKDPKRPNPKEPIPPLPEWPADSDSDIDEAPK